MAEKKSIMLYLNALEQWEMLSDEQAGVLIKAILRYGKDGEQLKTDDGMIAMAYSFITKQLDIDNEKYIKVCEKNAENIRKRWNKNNTTVYDRIPNDTNYTDKDKDKEKDKDKDKDIVINGDDKSSPTSTNQKRFVKPSLDEVKAYCQERGNSIDAERFIDYYESTGWKVGGKAAMKDWKAAVRNWEKRRNETSNTDYTDTDMSKYEAFINNF